MIYKLLCAWTRKVSELVTLLRVVEKCLHLEEMFRRSKLELMATVKICLKSGW